MKKLFALAVVILVATISKAQTTIDEYNYVIKGYKIQIESGLDMKKGYEISNMGTEATAERRVILKKLVRTNTKKTAAYMLEYKLGNNPAEYICIPSPNSSADILKLYWESLYNDQKVNASDRLHLILYTISLHALVW